MPCQSAKNAFTLIELAIVLVVIGLIVGGILVGQSLIQAATARSEVSQIEKFKTAVYTFKTKYTFLPGDIPSADAISFGFPDTCCTIQHGNNDGRINTTDQFSNGSNAGVFWWDLYRAGLIVEYIETQSDASGYYTKSTPAAKLPGNYVGVMSGGIADVSTDLSTGHGTNANNYFTMVDNKFDFWSQAPNPSVTVQDAYYIDTKMDDGLPQSGNVLAALWSKNTAPGCCIVFSWAGANIANLASGNNAQPTTTATPASSTTCYDNGNTANAVQKYSVGQNSGNGTNCGLSFKF